MEYQCYAYTCTPFSSSVTSLIFHVDTDFGFIFGSLHYVIFVQGTNKC